MASRTDPTHDAATPAELVDDLALVVDLVRRGVAATRPALIRETRLGRSIVGDRLADGARIGLLESVGTGASTGGRAPALWRYRADAGFVLSASLGVAAMTVAVTDAAGRLLDHSRVEWLINEGPAATLARIDTEFVRLWADRPVGDLWGIGIGLPGPVDHDSGAPVQPPIMAGWDGFDVRGWFAQRYRVGVWVDNDVNCMTIGHRAMHGADRDFVYVKVGTGIGAGLFSNGQLHRGFAGAAGDIGHVRITDRTDVICRCGRIGCLEAFAAGWALARDATTAAVQGRSVYLREILDSRGQIIPADVGRGSRLGEPVCVELEARSAMLLGNLLAVLVNFFNPRRIVIGGGVVGSGGLYVPAVERAVHERSNTLAARDLIIQTGDPDQMEGVLGCAQLVLDSLLSVPFLTLWAPSGTPHGLAAIVDRKVQGRPD